MEHPGVKTLLNRILKQNGGQINAAPLKAPPDSRSHDDGLEIVFNDPKQQQHHAKHLHKKPDETQSADAFTSFKENLRARMKARRQEMRKEEEEDAKMDEEYHGEEAPESADEEESDVEEGGNYKQNKAGTGADFRRFNYPFKTVVFDNCSR